MKCSECGNEIPKGEKHKRRESRPVCRACWYGEPTPLQPPPAELERGTFPGSVARHAARMHEGA